MALITRYSSHVLILVAGVFVIAIADDAYDEVWQFLAVVAIVILAALIAPAPPPSGPPAAP
jgi:hypothetical protein